MCLIWFCAGYQVAPWCNWHHLWSASWEGPWHWALPYPCAIQNWEWNCSQVDLAFWSLAIPGDLHWWWCIIFSYSVQNLTWSLSCSPCLVSRIKPDDDIARRSSHKQKVDAFVYWSWFNFVRMQLLNSRWRTYLLCLWRPKKSGRNFFYRYSFWFLKVCFDPGN